MRDFTSWWSKLLLMFVMNLILVGPCQSQSNYLFTNRNEPIGVISMRPDLVIDNTSSTLVDGYVEYTGSARFVFPVGNMGIKRPFLANGPHTIGAYYRADPSLAIVSNLDGENYSPLPLGAPFSRTFKEPSLEKVSNLEYWDIKSVDATTITLTWEENSNISDLVLGDINKLTIVGWNKDRWVIIPSQIDVPSAMGGESSFLKGSITSQNAINPNTYSVFTFGYIQGAALPVTLLSFNVKKEKDFALITWATISEVNCDRFEIEHSTDALNRWQRIGEIFTEGISEITKQYSLVRKLFSNDNYYRLKMIDKDGSYAYSSIRQITFSNEQKPNLFPNPASRVLHIKGIDVKRLDFLDTVGRQVFSCNSSEEYDLTNLKSGTYMVQITDTNNVVKTLKLIVIH